MYGWTLALRQFIPEDAQTYFDLLELNREYLSQIHLGGQDDTGTKYATVDDVLKSILEPEEPDKIRFGMWDGDTMVGTINLKPSEDRSLEVGYLVSEQHAGQGYATRSLKALSKYAFENQDIDALVADVYVGNDASKGVLEKAGFKYTKTFQRERNGKTEELWSYQLNKVKE